MQQTKSRVLGYKKATDVDWIDTYTYNYDAWARPIQTVGMTLNGQYNMNYTVLNYASMPTFAAHQFTGPDNQNRSTFQYNYYDHSLRPTYTMHKIALDNSWTNLTPDRKVSSLQYNFKDQLIKKKLGGVYQLATVTDKFTQSIDYQYNIRNWLTNINSGDISTTMDYPLAQGVSARGSVTPKCSKTERGSGKTLGKRCLAI